MPRKRKSRLTSKKGRDAQGRQKRNTDNSVSKASSSRLTSGASSLSTSCPTTPSVVGSRETKKEEDMKSDCAASDGHGETEDDILNKFDTADTAVLDQVDDELEDKLLNEMDELGTEIKATAILRTDVNKDKKSAGFSKTKFANGFSKKDTKTDLSNSDADEKDKCENTAVINDSVNVNESVSEDKGTVKVCANGSRNNQKVSDEKEKTESVPKDDLITSNSAKEAENNTSKLEATAKSDTSKLEEDATSGNLQSEVDAKRQKANAEFLKDQIMDTENLLQIVEKEIDEDKGSTGVTSPRSLEKGDTDDIDTETEKMDVDCDDTETERMDDEDNEEDRQLEKDNGKDDDEVDIDEGNLLRSESESELLYKKYKSMAVNHVLENKESTETTDQAANDSNEKENASALQSKPVVLSETCAEKESDSTCDNNDNEDGKTKAGETDEGCKRKQSPSPILGLPKSKKLDEPSEEISINSDTTPKTSKRLLSDKDIASIAKKLKLQNTENATKMTSDANKSKEQIPEGSKEASDESAAKETEKEEESVTDDNKAGAPPKVYALNAIHEYMKNKSLKKLRYKDLEQIILQKICEAIVYKSEMGEMRHRLGVLEQMIEMWRKKFVQQMKELRDLTIVHKRVLHDLRLNERDKPIIPVKITRSVGLQVRLDNMMNNVVTPKRRIVRPQVTNPQSTIAPAKQNRVNVVNKANTTNKTVMNKVAIAPKAVATRKVVTQRVTIPNKAATTNKFVMTNKVTPTQASKVKVLTPVTRGSLLSKALQNSVAAAAASTLPIGTPLSTANTSPSLVTPTSASVNTTPTLTATFTSINTSTTTPITKAPTNKSTIKQVADSKRVIDLTDEDDKKASTSPIKTVVSPAGVVNAPRIMYMRNNQLHQRVLQTDPTKSGTRKLMLKLNANVLGSANGVIATVPNGSANATIRASQPIRITKSVTPNRNTTTTTSTTLTSKVVLKHPAPLPPPPPIQGSVASRKPLPPKPHLCIKCSNAGLILSWKMPYNLDNFEAIASYQLYAYQETTSPPKLEMWRKVGDMKALALPMACTLTQFTDGNKYHFAVRAVDVHKRKGPFSDPEQILL